MCGTISGVMIDPNDIKNAQDEDAHDKKSGKFLLIIAILISILIVIGITIICMKKRDQKVQFAKSDPQNYRTINGSAATGSVAQSDDMSSSLVTSQ